LAKELVSDDVVLDVRDLVTEFVTPDGVGRAVDGLSFTVHRGETLGIVGESGCGKSISAMSILKLVPSPPGHVRSGTAELLGRDLLAMSDREIRDVRGKDISMIFQEPMTSLNPVLTIGYQIAEAVRRHTGSTRKAAKARAVEMLELVRIPEAAKRAREFPHQLSGGMRQRAMIAMALACDPKVLIADEPTTALDVTIQAQVLSLIRDLQAKLGTAVILITHDLGVVAETCQRVIVMYAGRKVEEAPVEDLFRAPLHPYTQGLLTSVPRLAADAADRLPRLNEIPGIVPAITEVISGCPFAPRCSRASEQCRADRPMLETRRENHAVACWHPGDWHE
jgi:peptide/nickel transport system ATP-binding protein